MRIKKDSHKSLQGLIRFPFSIIIQIRYNKSYCESKPFIQVETKTKIMVFEYRFLSIERQFMKIYLYCMEIN